VGGDALVTTATLLYGDLRTGRIIDTIDATSCPWRQVVNGAGSVGQVVVEAAEVRTRRLRTSAPAAKTFLAVDVGGVIQEAGPLWSRRWNEKQQELTLGAAGLWSLWDHRKVVSVLAAGQRVQDVKHTAANTDLGGIARSLVELAMTHAGGNLPVILPAARSGTRTETFHGWALPDLGDQLRQLTRRETAAPDIRFRPQYTTDRLGVEWVMEAGTEDAPLLVQAGEDWFFDHTVDKSPVVNIVTDEDGTQMGQRGWVTGSGSERDIRIGSYYAPALVDAGWPLLEVEEMRSTTLDQATLDQQAEALVDRSARPVEVWDVVVHASAAVEVLAGHYARVIPRRDSAWLGEVGEAYMRVAVKAGDLGDEVTLSMYEITGRLP
jgi:hypothetical protein